MVEDLRKIFSLDGNISCVMHETKIFLQGPPQLEDLRKKDDTERLFKYSTSELDRVIFYKELTIY